MKVLSMFFACLLGFSEASTLHQKRRECTLWTNNKPYIDDVPDIHDALERCGNGGRIIMWGEDTFNIRSPINLSKCKRCEFQIDGTLKMSSDWKYWSRQKEVIRISNASNIIITSGSAGTIDASNLGIPTGATPSNIPRLFTISNSNQIYIRNQLVRNVPGTVFQVDSGSSAIRFEGIDIQQPATNGLVIQNAKHVYLFRNSLRANKSCISISPEASNVEVDEVVCLTDLSTGVAPIGIDLKVGGPGITNSIRNIWVKTFRTIGWLDTVAFTGGSTQGASSTTELQNLTFVDFDVGDQGRQAVVVGGHSGKLVAKGVTFQSFNGTSQYQSDFKCPQKDDVCDFKVDGWNIAVRG